MITHEQLIEAMTTHTTNCMQCAKAVIESAGNHQKIIEGSCGTGKIICLILAVGAEHADRIIGSLPIVIGFQKHTKHCLQCQTSNKTKEDPACEVGKVYYEEWMKMVNSIPKKSEAAV